MAASVSRAAQFDLVSFGELTSDPSRVRILLSLMDGRTRPASELSRIAGVSASTASAHLKKLTLGGLLALEVMGRHRYYRLANEQVVGALEAVALLQPPRAPGKPSKLDPKRADFVHARTCWRHVAGELGVALFGALERERLVGLRDGVLALSESGVGFGRSLGIELARWPSGKPCVDLTERRFHLGGALGTLLTDRMFALRWIARVDDGRTVRVTTLGKRELRGRLALDWPH